MPERSRIPGADDRLLSQMYGEVDAGHDGPMIAPPLLLDHSMAISRTQRILRGVRWPDILLIGWAARALEDAGNTSSFAILLALVCHVAFVVMLVERAPDDHDKRYSRWFFAAGFALTILVLSHASVMLAVCLLMYAVLRFASVSLSDAPSPTRMFYIALMLTVQWSASYSLGAFPRIIDLFAVLCIAAVIMLFEDDAHRKVDPEVDGDDDSMSRQAFAITLSAVLLLAAFFGHAASSITEYGWSNGMLPAQLLGLSMLGLGFWLASSHRLVKNESGTAQMLRIQAIMRADKLCVVGGVFWFICVILNAMLPILL